MTPRVMVVVGFKGSGKTSLIEALMGELGGLSLIHI